MKPKPSECWLVFHKRQNDGTVAVCRVHPKRVDTEEFQWRIENGKPFFGERKSKKYRQSEPFVYISVSQRDKRSITDIVKEYLSRSDIINGYTKIDPRRIGSLKDVALYDFKKFLQQQNTPMNKVTSLQANWLHQAHRGGIMYASRGIYEVDKFDFTSHYPSVCNSDRLFPIGTPTKKTIANGDQVDLNVPALYRVEILGRHYLLNFKPKENFNEEGVVVTNLDLQNAQDLGVQYNFVKDKKPNCMEWESIQGHEIFKGFVDKYFEIKKSTDEETKKTGKEMLVTLTGMLVQKKHSFHKAKINLETASDVVDISDAMIDEFTMDSIKYHQRQSKIFKHPDLCKWGVWITAHGRRVMIQTLKDHQDYLVQVHTDGFILKTGHKLDLSTYIPGGELGGLKHEYEGKVEVVHVNKTIELPA